MFKESRVSVGEDVNVLEMDGGDGSTTRVSSAPEP